MRQLLAVLGNRGRGGSRAYREAWSSGGLVGKFLLDDLGKEAEGDLLGRWRRCGR
jgi:hypothetical protein